MGFAETRLNTTPLSFLMGSESSGQMTLKRIKGYENLYLGAKGKVNVKYLVN